jgi:hypothetical protein
VKHKLTFKGDVSNNSMNVLCMNMCHFYFQFYRVSIRMVNSGFFFYNHGTPICCKIHICTRDISSITLECFSRNCIIIAICVLKINQTFVKVFVPCPEFFDPKGSHKPIIAHQFYRKWECHK